jgi:hypothetical protein
VSLLLSCSKSLPVGNLFLMLKNIIKWSRYVEALSLLLSARLENKLGCLSKNILVETTLAYICYKFSTILNQLTLCIFILVPFIVMVGLYYNTFTIEIPSVLYKAYVFVTFSQICSSLIFTIKAKVYMSGAPHSVSTFASK